MKALRIAILAVAIGLLSLPVRSFAQLSAFLDYVYMSDIEVTEFNEIIWFWTPDSLYGDIHSNDGIGVKMYPVCFGYVSTTEEDFIHGGGAYFISPYDPIFNAPEVILPSTITWLEEAATEQGTYFSGVVDSLQYICRATSLGWLVRSWEAGVPYGDGPITEEGTFPYDADRALYFNGDLMIEGDHVLGGTGIGVAGDVYLIDNLVYEGVDPDSWPETLSDTVSSRVGIIGLRNIYIADTPANGQGNGYVYHGWMPDSSSLVVTAALVALDESITFEHQNDTWDDYFWCDPQGDHVGETDERGVFRVIGSIVQQRRGYMHRSNCGGTGYAKQYYYDDRFRNNPPPHMYPDDFRYGDQVWADTMVTVQSRFNFRRNNLTLGPGTEIHVVDPDPEGVFFFYAGAQFRIDGTPDNPVVIMIEGGEDETANLVGWDERTGDQAILADTTWNDFVIKGYNVRSVIPQNLYNARFEVGNMTVVPHEDLETSPANPMVLEKVVFLGDQFELENEDDQFVVLKRSEMHGTTISRFSELDRITFSSDAHVALSNQVTSAYIVNTFFDGSPEWLVNGLSAFIDFSAWYGFEGDTPFSQAISVGDDMLGEVDPLFADSYFHLSAGSPLIDAGDPSWEFDPDSTVADIGAYYFDQLGINDPVYPQKTIPESFGIASVFPNPFNPVTQVNIALPQADRITVEVLDILGRRVALLQDGLVQAGTHSLTFNGAALASGTYFVRVAGRQGQDVSKILLLK